MSSKCIFPEKNYKSHRWEKFWSFSIVKRLNYLKINVRTKILTFSTIIYFTWSQNSYPQFLRITFPPLKEPLYHPEVYPLNKTYPSIVQPPSPATSRTLWTINTAAPTTKIPRSRTHIIISINPDEPLHRSAEVFLHPSCRGCRRIFASVLGGSHVTSSGPYNRVTS